MEKVRLGLEWFLNPDHVPFLVGLEQGWFADRGIDLELIEPAEHLDAIEAIEAGQMDVAITEPIHLVADAADGKPVRGFARFLHTNGGVMYFADRGVSRPRDMAGKRLQYPGAPGPGGPAIVRTMIARDGGDADADVTPVNNGFYHTNALAEDMADMATLVFYNFEIIEARHRGLEPRFFALKDWDIPDFCQLILISSPTILKKRQDTIRGLVDVVRRGIDFIHQYPTEAKQIYDRRAGTDPDDAMMRDIYDATVRCFTFDFQMTRSYYRALRDWMRNTGQIATKVKAQQCWTNRFA